jgi:glycosyltransferase involved in cell wall biosynthesis
MNKRTFFSVVMCTRNRPEIVKYAILALQNQSFEDFEVILSDNSDPEIKKQNQEFIAQLEFQQLKYITPEKVLSMHDNYNFGLNEASGEYIGISTDKFFFKQYAFKDLYSFLRNNAVDIINYNANVCFWHPERKFPWSYRHFPASYQGGAYRRSDFEFYNPKEELAKLRFWDVRLEDRGIHFKFGKIFFGFYHHTLIDKIKSKYGQLFYPISCDHSSLPLALNLAEKTVFYHRPLISAVDNFIGNGAKIERDYNSAIEFLKTCTDDVSQLLSSLPIPNIPALHNIYAYDYQILNRLEGTQMEDTQNQINMSALALRVYEDLRRFPEEQREVLYGKLFKFIEDHKITFDKRNCFFIETKKGMVATLRRRSKKLFSLLLYEKNKFPLLMSLAISFLQFHFRRHRTIFSFLDK